LKLEKVGRHDNFFTLGGNSLTSIQMLARAEQVFNREIELRAIFEFPVLKDCSAYVDQLTGPAQPATLRPIVPTARDGDLPRALFAAPTRMAEHIAAVNEPDRSQSSPVLVNIQPHGSWPPFFCVHAVGGQVISYAGLSQELGLEQPFYGLQS